MLFGLPKLSVPRRWDFAELANQKSIHRGWRNVRRQQRNWRKILGGLRSFEEWWGWGYGRVLLLFLLRPSRVLWRRRSLHQLSCLFWAQFLELRKVWMLRFHPRIKISSVFLVFITGVDHLWLDFAGCATLPLKSSAMFVAFKRPLKSLLVVVRVLPRVCKTFLNSCVR